MANNDPPMMFSDEEEEFARLFEEAGASQRPGPRLHQGDSVSGRIIRIGPEHTFIDLGGKAEGAMDSVELADTDFKQGDTIEAIVVSTQHGIHLSRTLAGAARDEETLREAHAAGVPVEGRLESRNKGGYEVRIGNLRGFVPVSHVALESIPDDQLDSWVGQTHRFLIIEFDPSRRKLVLSRRELLKKERAESAERVWAELQEGQTRTGTVRSVQDFGAFVDLGGVDGLVHISEMAWSRFARPSDLVRRTRAVRVSTCRWMTWLPSGV